MNMPGFTAELALDHGRTAYRGSASGHGAETDAAAVQPAARRIFYCSMKGCCLDLRDLGYPRICCNGDECGSNIYF